MEINTDKVTIGLSCEQRLTVTDNDTAAKYGSGLMKVFATPALVALMEKTAIHNLEELLPSGYTTVGTLIQVQHLKASPIGATIRCCSQLTHKEGRRLHFHIEAYEGETKIGEAEHERFIVNAEHFMSKFNN